MSLAVVPSPTRLPPAVSLEDASLPPAMLNPELPRVILCCTGFPAGLIDLASWIDSQRRAQISVLVMPKPLLTAIAEHEDPNQRLWELLGAGAEQVFAPENRRGDDTFEYSDGPGRAAVIKRCGDRQLVFGYDAAEFDRPLFETCLYLYARREQRALDDALRLEFKQAAALLGCRLIQSLILDRPDVVGFSFQSGDGDALFRARLLLIKEIAGCETAIGGAQATRFPIETLRDFGADFVFSGEAEETFSRYLTRVAECRTSHNPEARRAPRFSRALAEISGLAWEFAGKLYHNRLPDGGYQNAPAGGKTPLGPRILPALIRANAINYGLMENAQEQQPHIRLGRGCPGICIWCSQEHGAPRLKTPDQLFAEVLKIDSEIRSGRIAAASSARWGARLWLNVFDEDFLVSRAPAKEFLRLFAAARFHNRFLLNFQTNPASFYGAAGRPDRELRALLETVKPCIQIGGESFNPELLERWRKRHTLPQLEDTVEWLETAGRDYVMNIILGDHRSTAEEVTESLFVLTRRVLSTRHMEISVSPFAGFESGSAYREEALASGLLTAKQLKQHDRDGTWPADAAEDPLGGKLIRMVGRFVMEQEEAAALPQDEVYYRSFRLLTCIIKDEAAGSEAGADYRAFRLGQLQKQAAICLERLTRQWPEKHPRGG